MAVLQTVERTLVTAVDSTTVVINGVLTSSVLVLVVSVFNPDGTAVTVTGGGTWALAGTAVSVGSYVLTIHYLAAPIGGGTTITIDPVGGSADVVGVVLEASVLNQGSLLDEFASNTGTSASPSVAYGTLDQADQLVVSAVINGGGVAYSSGDGLYTFIDDSDTDPGYYAQYRIVSSTAGDTINYTLAGSADWAAAVATFRASGGGGEPPALPFRTTLGGQVWGR